MSDTLLPENDNTGNTGRMSRELEIKFGNKVQTNEFNEIIIVKKNRKSKKLILFLIIIIIAIISGTVFLVFFFSNRKSVCESGENEKCKTCNIFNKCNSCNPGYKLKEEACIINYSFEALYYTKTPNEEVNLLGEFNFRIEEMFIDGKKVDPCRKYKFESIGSHSVLVLIDLSKKTSLESMFLESEMISIYFTEKFNTEKIEGMNYMFDTCKKLTSIDLSVFNTRNVLDMQGSLVSVIHLNQ